MLWGGSIIYLKRKPQTKSSEPVFKFINRKVTMYGNSILVDKAHPLEVSHIAYLELNTGVADNSIDHNNPPAPCLS